MFSGTFVSFFLYSSFLGFWFVFLWVRLGGGVGWKGMGASKGGSGKLACMGLGDKSKRGRLFGSGGKVLARYGGGKWDRTTGEGRTGNAPESKDLLHLLNIMIDNSFFFSLFLSIICRLHLPNPLTKFYMITSKVLFVSGKTQNTSTRENPQRKRQKF